ncbi:hypothetical protein SSU98_1043 [Streptococcus suis 98HAH33]|nr:hypothetical protein SSU05_1032 [Streptococcus suis 05ZYH33]ABP92200.1 hypothetical protein SSU98_1043 [Streptococcus suis 98HAH33]
MEDFGEYRLVSENIGEYCLIEAGSRRQEWNPSR